MGWVKHWGDIISYGYNWFFRGRHGLLSSPFYRWGTCNLKILDTVLKDPQLVKDEVELKNQNKIFVIVETVL